MEQPLYKNIFFQALSFFLQDLRGRIEYREVKLHTYCKILRELYLLTAGKQGLIRLSSARIGRIDFRTMILDSLEEKLAIPQCDLAIS